MVSKLSDAVRFCEIITEKPSRTNRAVSGHFDHPLTDFGERRALSNASRAPVARVSASITGQSSLSTKIAAEGRQCARKRDTGAGASSGANWCCVRGGRRRPISSAEVAVPEVMRKFSRGIRSPMREIRVRTERLSPTLAAWNQASGPSGRAALASPRRSRIRSSATPARRSLRASEG